MGYTVLDDDLILNEFFHLFYYLHFPCSFDSQADWLTCKYCTSAKMCVRQYIKLIILWEKLRTSFWLLHAWFFQLAGGNKPHFKMLQSFWESLL